MIVDLDFSDGNLKMLVADRVLNRPRPPLPIDDGVKRGLDAYSAKTGAEFIMTGFFEHPVIPFAGAYIDALLDDQIVHVMTVSVEDHLHLVATGKLEDWWEDELTWMLACSKRKSCKVISYNKDVDKVWQLFVKDFKPTEKQLNDVQLKVDKFEQKISELALKMEAMRG